MRQPGARMRARERSSARDGGGLKFCEGSHDCGLTAGAHVDDLESGSCLFFTRPFALTSPWVTSHWGFSDSAIRGVRL